MSTQVLVQTAYHIRETDIGSFVYQQLYHSGMVVYRRIVQWCQTKLQKRVETETFVCVHIKIGVQGSKYMYQIILHVLFALGLQRCNLQYYATSSAICEWIFSYQLTFTGTHETIFVFTLVHTYVTLFCWLTVAPASNSL